MARVFSCADRIEVTAVATIGNLLDSLGVEAEINDGDLVSSAIVVMAVLVDGDPHPRLTIANSDGMSWIEQAGLMRLLNVDAKALSRRGKVGTLSPAYAKQHERIDAVLGDLLRLSV